MIGGRKRFAIVMMCMTIGWMLPGGVEGDDRPNIVFMLSDDQSWNGLSVAMHPEIAGSRGSSYHTPNLERLASEGMRFSAGYAPAPVCSPTRISLQTGRSPAALHWTKAAPAELGHKFLEPRLIKSISSEETTIGEMLRGAGYATAHYGKWHLSGGGPGKHGYDEHDGDTGNEQAFAFKDPNPVDIFGMAERAEKFMEKSRKEGKPFFVQLSWNALHASENAMRATLTKYEQDLSGQNSKQIAVAAITEDLDTGVGKVLDAIEKLGLRKTTYVIYMSDNGSGGGKKVLRGGKGGVWEGGIRVPLIIRGPGVAANSWCHVPVVGYDLYPTFCEWGKVPRTKLPKGLEGGSITELLVHDGKGAVVRSRPGILFHFPHYQGADGPQSAWIEGDLKLMKIYEDERVELYDLSQDPGERRNLSEERKEDAVRMKRDLDRALASVDAQIPIPNPDYDPSVEPSRKRGGGQGGAKPGGKRPPGGEGGRGGRKKGIQGEKREKGEGAE